MAHLRGRGFLEGGYGMWSSL
jgi:hypothetical protein